MERSSHKYCLEAFTPNAHIINCIWPLFSTGESSRVAEPDCGKNMNWSSSWAKQFSTGAHVPFDVKLLNCPRVDSKNAFEPLCDDREPKNQHILVLLTRFLMTSSRILKIPIDSIIFNNFDYFPVSIFDNCLDIILVHIKCCLHSKILVANLFPVYQLSVVVVTPLKWGIWGGIVLYSRTSSIISLWELSVKLLNEAQ